MLHNVWLLYKELTVHVVFFSGVDVMFTEKNVQGAVKNVRDTERLGYWLRVIDRKSEEIEIQFSGDHQNRVKQHVKYFMDNDPLASWRRIIVVLDAMGEKEAAEKIRHLAEGLAGESR